MKKNLTRIADLIYNKVWAITPSTHQIIRNQFEEYVKNGGTVKADMEDDKEEECVEECTVTNTNGVAVISIEGVIGKGLSLLETSCGGVDLNRVNADLKKCAADENISTIVLYINSPGGTVTGVSETADLISEIDKTKPVYCYTDGQLCSAAYWLGSQCRSIVCSPSADVGSVGVYCILYDCTDAYRQEGIKVNPIVNGKYKVMGADFKELTAEERALFQADVDKIATKFKAAVTSKRTINSEYLEGQVFDGEDAVTNGFCDGICNDIEQFLTLILTNKE